MLGLWSGECEIFFVMGFLTRPSTGWFYCCFSDVEAQSSTAAKYYGLKRVATDNISSGTFYHTELADPSNLLKRAYLNQLNVGETKLRKETRFAE